MVFSRPGPTFLQQPAAGAASSQQQREQQLAGSQSSAARTQHLGASLFYRVVSDDTLGDLRFCSSQRQEQLAASSSE